MRKELIILGASGSLGRGITDFFLQKDYNKIYLVGRKMRNTPGNKNAVILIADDLTVEENVRKLFSSIKAEPETLYFLFDTIGGYSGGAPVWETPFEDFDRMIKINTYTAFLAAKYFALLVKQSAGGAICFTSSMTSLIPEAKKMAYGASKSALNYLVKSLALEGRQINMSVNAVAPSIIDTEENLTWVKNTETLIKPVEIGQLVHELFTNYRFTSGSIIELPVRLS